VAVYSRARDPSLRLCGNARVSLCLECGLCCDGTMFQVVPLEAGEAEAVAACGTLGVHEGRTVIRQRCGALGVDLKCGVYSVRPVTCRKFECAALVGLQRGELSETEAREVIGEVLGRRRAVAVAMGVADEAVALREARARDKAGTLGEEVSEALSRLRRALVLLQVA